VGGAEVFVERARDGSFNVACLVDAIRRYLPNIGDCPAIDFDRINLRYTDLGVTDDEGQPLSLELRNISASIGRGDDGSGTISATVSVNDPQFGRWTLSGTQPEASKAAVSLKVKTSAIELSEELAARLAGGARELWERFKAHAGTVRVAGTIDYDADKERPFDFELRADIENASVAYAPFPYELTSLNGAIVLRRDGIELENLESASGSSVVRLHGHVAGLGPRAPVDVRIEGRRLPMDAKMRAALNESRRDVWDDFDPDGFVDVVCRVDRETAPPNDLRLRLIATNSPSERLTARHREFPYPLEIEGWVSYDRGMVTIVQPSNAARGLELRAERPVEQQAISTEKLDDFTPGVLVARHDDVVIEVRGDVRRGAPNRLVNLDFRLREGDVLPLDQDLKQALSPAIRELWDYLQLEGSASARCRVERTDANESALDVVVQITDIRTRIRARDFPYEIRDLDGSVVYERRSATSPRGRLLVKNLSTVKGNSTVLIDGEVCGFRREKPVEKMDLTIRAGEVQLDEELRRLIPGRFSGLWDYLSPTPESSVNVECRLVRTDPDAKRSDFRLSIDSVDSSLSCADFPYRVEHLRGLTEYRLDDGFPEGLLQFRDLKSDVEGTRIAVRGVLAGFAAAREIDSVNLVIEGRGVPLDEKLRAALASDHRKTFEAFHPEGRVDVTCGLSRASRDEKLSAELSIIPLGSSLCHDALPLRLTDVAGLITITDDAVKLSKVKGKALGGVVSLDGAVYSDGPAAAFRQAQGPERPSRGAGQSRDASAPHSTRRRMNLTLTGHDVTIGPEIEAVLPENHRRLWRKLAPRGKAALTLTVKQTEEGVASDTVDYSLILRPRELSLACGIGLDNAGGVIKLDGSVSREGHDFRGRADMTRASIGGTELSGLRASFEKHRNIFSIYDLDARVYEGEITAQLRMDLDDPITYGVVADARSLQLNGILRRICRIDDDGLQGLLSGRLLLQGQGADAANLVGRAELRVREGRLWEIPFVFSLFKVLNLSLPERTAFTDATVSFDFYNRHVLVKQLDLAGDAFSIYGAGAIEPNGAVDLSFETGWGRFRLPKLPLISPVVRGLQKQIVSVRMTGKLNEPRIEILPIVPITAPVKGFLDTVSRRNGTKGRK
jgi:hypothetical protein